MGKIIRINRLQSNDILSIIKLNKGLFQLACRVNLMKVFKELEFQQMLILAFFYDQMNFSLLACELHLFKRAKYQIDQDLLQSALILIQIVYLQVLILVLKGEPDSFLKSR